MDDRMMKYINIGLGVVIAIVAIVAGVLFFQDKSSDVATANEQEEIAEELATASTEAAEAEASYIEIPGWTDRADVEGDKEGISLEEAAKQGEAAAAAAAAEAASSQATTSKSTSSSSTASTTKKTTSSSTTASTTKKADTSTAASTTKTADAASSASTTTDASTAGSSVITTVTDDDLAKLNEWKSDDNNHWKAGTPNDKSAHTFNTSGVCTVCGYKLTWKYTTKNHYHLVNGKQTDVNAHTYNDNGICAVCGYKGSVTGNVGASAYNYNQTTHWHTDSNGNKVDVGEHQKYYNSKGVCTICGYVNSDLASTADAKWQPNGGAGHCKKDSNGVIVLEEAHTFNKDGVCTVCGYTITKYSYKDGSGHYLVNMGKQATETVAHTYENGGHTCTVCGYVSDHNYVNNGDGTHRCTICGKSESHTYDSNGKCTVCSYTKPADPTPTTPTEEKDDTTGGDTTGGDGSGAGDTNGGEPNAAAQVEQVGDNTDTQSVDNGSPAAE